MQVYWKGLPFPPPGDLPDPGIEPTSPAPPVLAGGFFTMCHQGNPGKVSLHSQRLFSYLLSGFSHFATSNSFVIRLTSYSLGPCLYLWFLHLPGVT